MSDTLYTLVSGVTGFQQVEDTPVHVNTNALLLSGHLGTSTNATINGNITVTGNVDGRDVAADGILIDRYFNDFTNISVVSGKWNRTERSMVTDIRPNSARWDTNANTEIAAASARYNRTATSLETNVTGNTANWNTAYTHSQGSVTDHNDVSNAGSGQIITTDERDKFTRTWTNLSTNSADYNEQFNSSEIAAASARYSRTATSLETNVVPNTADWNYTAANSAITLETSSHDYLSISNREITLGEVDISDDTNLAANNGITLTGDTLSINSVSASNFTAAYDHSRGNVTDHADVSNAGSGQIITSDERDRFGRAWTNISSNSADYNEQFNSSEIAAASARYTQTALSLETNVVPATGSWNSTNTTLVANSARWDTNANTEIAAASADWNYTASNTAISVAFDVTNNGSGAYRFNNGGFTNDDNPTVHLQRGHTYRFRVNASGHPFYLKSSAGTGTGNQYLSGVSGNGAQVGNVDFEVPHDAPRQLFYQCSAHSSMVGSIHVVEGTATTAVFNNSANWNNAYTRSNNNFSTLNSNSADWNYTAANSAAHANEFSFKTITLSANRASAATGADIVADSTTDTLTLCAGPNIELISEPGSDVITISGSAGGGGASGEDNENSYKTIALSGNRGSSAIGADVVADSTTDTLTLCAGPNIVLLSDPTNDVITISGSAGGGGGASGEDNEFSFKTITLSANRASAAIGADVVADTTTDTLTLCAGPNIQLISEAGSDVITISGGTSIITDNSTTTHNAYYSGAGPTVAYQQTLTGNGSTTIFEVSATISDDFLALVLIEGVMQIPTTHYSVSASHVHALSTVKDMVFNTAPGSGERIDVRVFKDANTIEQVSTTTINNTVYSGATVTSTSNLTGTGTTHVFEVSARLSEAAMAIVSVGGIIQIPTTHYTVSAAAAHPTNADVADINFNIAPLSGEAIEIRGLHDGSMVNVSTVNNTYTTVNNNSATWQLRLQEIDGTPNTVPITAVKVPNGTLTTSNKTATLDYINQGALSELISTSGNWNSTYTTLKANSAEYESVYSTTKTYSADWSYVAENSGSGGGTDLTVSEIDGTPSVSAVSAIKVTNGTLTVSNGTATIDTGGGSTGPFTSASGKFYSTNGNDKMGLGTSAPYYKLDITDTGAAFIHLSGKGNSAEAGIHMRTDARGGYTIYMENSSQGEDDMLNINCGPVGANSVVMMLSGIPEVSNSGVLDINHIYARTKIGVGTDKPGEALSVVGNISASGDITAANNSYKFADGQKLTSGNVTDLKAASAGNITVTNLGTDNTPTVDFNAGQMQRVAINGDCTFQNATNVAIGGNVVLQITGDSGAARTLAFPAVWKFIGAKPTTIKAGGLSLLQLLVFSGTGQDNIVCTYNTQD